MENLQPTDYDVSDATPISDSSFPSFDNYRTATAAYLKNENGLHNAENGLPHEVILSEKPEHRLILYLKLNGHSTKEISKLTGYTTVWVRQVVRQPWFRQKFVEEAKSAGLDSVTKFLESEVLESLEVIREIRDSGGEKGSTRLAAANALLDRHLGKPMQKVITDNTHRNVEDVTTEASAIDIELAQLEDALKSRGV